MKVKEDDGTTEFARRFAKVLGDDGLWDYAEAWRKEAARRANQDRETGLPVYNAALRRFGF